MGRKRSSCSKRKSSKLHPEGRKKKKSRTTKSKKLRSRKDYSSYSSDDSRSLASVSSSSSEDDHHRSRSRRKSELKGNKKRAREKSSKKSDKVLKIKKPHKKKVKRESSFTSLSSDSHSHSTDTKKKLRKRRQKRERSVDYITSDSHSCSTFSDTDESKEIASRRGRSREKSKGEKNLPKTKRLKVRSRSRSPYNRNDDETYNSLPVAPTENNSRRLRSVITVVTQPEDDLKEEMVHGHSGYPSSRSNDSADVDIKRDLDHSSQVNLETGDLRNMKRDEASVSDFNKAGNENKREEEISPVLPNTENDLESILRLKALENMIKYKGAQIEKLKVPIKPRNSKLGEQSRIPDTQKPEPSTIPKKIQKVNLMVAENVVNAKSAITSENVPIANKATERDNNVLESSTSEPSAILNKAHNANSLVSESNVARKAAPSSEFAGQASKSSGRVITLKSSISEPIKNVTEEAQNANTLVSERSVNNKEAWGRDSEKDEKDNKVPESSMLEPSSSLKPILEDNSSKEHQNADKDGSQFEQKTMTVMRGGEMVEVSYKVYIPKRAPALARRPLRR